MILPGFPRPMVMVKKGFDPSTPLGTFIEGGYYVGNITDPDDGMGGLTWAMILSPKASGQNNSLQWKTSNTTTPGTGSYTNGLANSNAMNNANHPAALFCRGLTIGGYSDWYLFSRQESINTYANKTVIVGADAIDADSLAYWSSTERSAELAFTRTFSDGLQPIFNKSDNLRVRAMRRVLIG